LIPEKLCSGNQEVIVKLQSRLAEPSEGSNKLRGKIPVVVAFWISLAWSTLGFATALQTISLDQMAQQSNVIFKAKVISSSPIIDEWFENVPGYKTVSTRMQVISAMKGALGPQFIEFHHYSIDKNATVMSMSMLQVHEFEPNRNYIVFSIIRAQDGVLRQFSKNASMFEQGVYLAADDAVVRDGKIADVLYFEFTKLLASPNSEDVLYGIRLLDRMSNPLGRLTQLQDFDRTKVLQAISPLMSNREEKVAKAAIQAVGGSNPYFKDDDAISWLAKIGGRTLPGIAPWESDQNPGAHEYYRQLVEIADGTGPIELRALAIRALGRAGVPDLLHAVLRWAHSAEPQIREAATLLLADFPAASINDCILSSLNDTDSRVRKASIRVIGFAQTEDLLPILGQALHDSNNALRGAAALSLASFSPKKSGDILRANIEDSDYKAVFVNILASENAKPYVGMLSDIIQKRQSILWAGTIPYAESWDILFKYLKTQTSETLQSGQFNNQLEVLEKAEIFSSSPPRDLYQFYLKNGLNDRAAKFREYIRRTSNFDMELYFKRVDAEYGGSK
jgi:hypothetical protein